MGKSQLEDDLARRIDHAGLPTPERQYPFAASVGRKHRFDFAWPDRMLAVEVDGGTHLAVGNRAVGWHASKDDYRKRNLAAMLGWRILAYRPDMIRSGDAIFDLTHLLLSARTDSEGIIERQAYYLAQESAARRRKRLKAGAKRRGR
jgi:very-short-patch-repair endonuclease